MGWEIYYVHPQSAGMLILDTLHGKRRAALQWQKSVDKRR